MIEVNGIFYNSQIFLGGFNLKILNLYAGICGNRRLWGDEHFITAVEYNPKIAELRQRNQILSWAGELSNDKEWLIQKALANWLSSLSKHDTPAVLLFLETHGAKMKPFAINEACKFL